MIIRKYLGDNINLEVVLVDENALVGTKKLSLAYVLYNTINTRKKMAMKLLIHEIIHIWQYQMFGSIYILHALIGQRSTDGYNYGGFNQIYQKALRGSDFIAFNFEQMAEIAEDYFQYKSNPAQALYFPYDQYYTYFLDQMKQPV